MRYIFHLCNVGLYVRNMVVLSLIHIYENQGHYYQCVVSDERYIKFISLSKINTLTLDSNINVILLQSSSCLLYTSRCV